MANNQETIDQVGGDISDATNQTVDQIGSNLSEVASDVGNSIKQALIGSFDGALLPPNPSDIPVPEVISAAPPSEKAHMILKEAVAQSTPSSVGTETTLRDQFQQAESQFSRLG